MGERLGEAILDLKTRDKGFGKGVDRAEKRAKRLEKRLIGVAKVAGIAAGAIALMFARKSINAAIEQEQAMKGVESVIRTTGQAAGFTAEEVARLASSLQRFTGIGDQEILRMQNIILTFKNVSGEAFKRVTALVLDMATVFQTDLKSAALQLAKALDAPAERIASLAEAGITFSAAQIQMVKSMVATNRLLDAQSLILDVIEGQLGGAAKAARDTLGGAFRALGSEITNLGELLAEQSIAGGVLRTWVELWISAAQSIQAAFASIPKSREELEQLKTDTEAYIALLESMQIPWFDRLLGEEGLTKAAIKNLEDAKNLVEEIAAQLEKMTPETEAQAAAVAEAAAAAAEAAAGEERRQKAMAEAREQLELFPDLIDAATARQEAWELAIRDSTAAYREMQESAKLTTEDLENAVGEGQLLTAAFETAAIASNSIEDAVNDIDFSGLMDSVDEFSKEYEQTITETNEETWNEVRGIIGGAMAQAFAAIVQGADATATAIQVAFIAAGAAIGAKFGSAQLGAQIGGLLGGLFGGGGDSAANKAAAAAAERQRELARAQEFAAATAAALAITHGDLTVSMRAAIRDAQALAVELVRMGIADASVAFEGLAQTFQGMRDSILGITETAEERIKREAAEFNAEIALVRAEAILKQLDLLAQRDILEARAKIAESQLGIDRALVAGMLGVAKGTHAAAQVIFDSLAAIDAALEGIDLLLGSLPDLISDAEIATAIANVTSSASSFSKSMGSMRQSIKDTIAEIKAALESLESFRLSLITGPGSPIPSADQLLALQLEVAEAFNDALASGDPSDFISDSEALLALAEALFGSGAGFQTIFDDILAKTEDLEAAFGEDLEKLLKDPAEKTAENTEKTAKNTKETTEETKSASKTAQDNATKAAREIQDEVVRADRRFDDLGTVIATAITRIGA